MHIPPTRKDLAYQIKRLKGSREKHAAALAEIDLVLSRISQALQAHPPAPLRNAVGPAGARTLGEGGRRKYRKMEQTGDQAVLAFVKERGTATTAEINAHWRAEGRGGVANNAIVRLLKRGDLVREASPGSRGGRYRYQDNLRRQSLADAIDEPADDVLSPSSPGSPGSNRGSHFFSDDANVS